MADVRWATAFLDVPGPAVEATVAFWRQVSGTRLSPWRGDRFATLLPADGTPHLALQRVDDGPGGVHLDLHVPDGPAAAAEATALGAERQDAFDDCTVLRSPGGFGFCVVERPGTGERSAPVGPPGARSRLDQVCLDVPPASFDTEVAFWSALTGWPPLTGSRPEFVPLSRPAGLPVRLLLQRLDDRAGPPTAHLDLACEDRDAEVARHEALGAAAVRRTEGWTTLTDPVGRPYCCTRRQPLAPPPA